MSNSKTVGARGSALLLEVRPASTSGDLASRVVVPEEFRSRAGEIATSIAEVVDHFRSRLARKLDKGDDSGWHVGSIEVTFGIAVQAEAGVVITKASAGATFSARFVLQPVPDQQK